MRETTMLAWTVVAFGIMACGDSGGGAATRATDAATPSGDTSVATSADATSSAATDTGVTSAPDTATTTPDTTTTDTTAVDADATAPTCTEVALAGPLVWTPYLAPSGEIGGFLFILGERLDTDLGFGGPGPDELVVEFNTEDPGPTFDLGASSNAGYAGCEQCVLVHVDVGTASETTLLHAAGTLTIEMGAPSERETRLRLTDLELHQVVLDGASSSVEVPNGACYTTASATLGAPACEPSCGAGDVCGADGCGGVCGGGCAGDATFCALDAQACLATPAVIAPDGTLAARADGAGGFDDTVYDLALDDPAADAPLGELTIAFYGAWPEPRGTFPTAPVDFAVAPDNDNATCQTCVYVAIEEAGGVRIFMPSRGTFTVDTAASDQAAGRLVGTFADVRLVEMMFDEDSFASSPVAGGSALDLGPSVTVTTEAPPTP